MRHAQGFTDGLGSISPPPPSSMTRLPSCTPRTSSPSWRPSPACRAPLWASTSLLQNQTTHDHDRCLRPPPTPNPHNTALIQVLDFSHATTDPGGPDPEITTGVRYLGQPIGSAAFASAYLQEAPNTYTTNLTKLRARLTDHHTQFLLFKSCTNPPSNTCSRPTFTTTWTLPPLAHWTPGSPLHMDAITSATDSFFLTYLGNVTQATPPLQPCRPPPSLPWWFWCSQLPPGNQNSLCRLPHSLPSLRPRYHHWPLSGPHQRVPPRLLG